ncbi:MAG: glutaredoxin family protein [Steroidobacteraceae bacterium]
MQNHSSPGAELPPGLILLTRPECGLCEEFLQELQQLAASRPLPPVSVVDVDGYPELARRHGLDIPVLLWDGVKVCQHRLDREEFLRLLRPRRQSP